MKIKINGRPLRVEEEVHVDIDYIGLFIGIFSVSLVFYLLDYIAFVFLGIHPFPFMRFMGVFLQWLR